MRSNKGITLTSLIIYVIIFSIVIGTVAMISKYFATNLDEVILSSNLTKQYTRLITYLSEDINSENRKSIVTEDHNIKITFLDNSIHRYIYFNKSMYCIISNQTEEVKKIKLCDNITAISSTIVGNKLKVIITIDGINYQNNYSL